MTQENLPAQEKSSERPDGAAELSLRALVLERLNKEKKKPELFGDEDDGFVESLKGIKQFLSLDEDTSVIYPGSGVHVGVARVFGKENVTHVDPDENVAEALSDNGYRAVESTIEDYTPSEPFDGMVALNSYGSPSSELVETLVKPGGFIVANNHTQWAAGLAKLDDTVELVGAIMPDYRLPDAELVEGSEVPEGATDLVTQYFIVDKDANFETGTPEDYTVKNESPKYPDALFIFRRT